ncbi:hypothetical protein [Anaerostipes sp.]|uniref:hypothetical protein n=1 Tax=Anaerostipes sp. TaxID=1872530 RepID=UPI0025C661E5|nr:hypothetical protein [Anaerostipes sp.]MBS7009306.1 hypothetical protein [Anaerostipes sp.]
MKLVWLALVIGLKSVLTKFTAFIFVFALFLLKDKSICLSPGKWSEFLSGLSKRQIKIYAVFIYTAAAFISSTGACFALSALKFQNALAIAVLLFLSGFAVRGFQFYKLWKHYIIKRRPMN